jgi:hypothetical protein
MNARDRRRQRRQLQVTQEAELVLAWYGRDAWERLREIADDAQVLDDTYEEWEAGALDALRCIQSLGRTVVKVPIDIDALLVWCHANGRRIDSAARAEYVIHLQQINDKPR